MENGAGNTENYRPVFGLPALNNTFEKLPLNYTSSVLKYGLTTFQLIGDTIANEVNRRLEAYSMDNKQIVAVISIVYLRGF